MNNIEPKKKWQHWPLPTLEITTTIPEKGCIVDCAFCPQRVLENVYKGTRILTLDNFKFLIDKVPKDVRITFAGFTEPWMNKYCTDMVLYAHEQGHPISVFTTGVGMNVEELELLVNLPYQGGPNGGFILHLPDKELLARHPLTPGYFKVLEWFQLNNYKIQNFNIMCMGETHPDIAPYFYWAPNHKMWSRAGNLVRESLLKPKLLNLKDRWDAIYHEDQNRTCGCEEHLYHNVMLPNGDISLCCMDYGLDHILGNLYEKKYESIIPNHWQKFNLCNYCENGVNPDKVEKPITLYKQLG
jgi:MoaA/NifB/PqqE/SkfB family radical SAM enzyme